MFPVQFLPVNTPAMMNTLVPTSLCKAFDYFLWVNCHSWNYKVQWFTVLETPVTNRQISYQKHTNFYFYHTMFYSCHLCANKRLHTCLSLDNINSPLKTLLVGKAFRWKKNCCFHLLLWESDMFHLNPRCLQILTGTKLSSEHYNWVYISNNSFKVNKYLFCL